MAKRFVFMQISTATPLGFTIWLNNSVSILMPLLRIGAYPTAGARLRGCFVCGRIKASGDNFYGFSLTGSALNACRNGRIYSGIPGVH